MFIQLSMGTPIEIIAVTIKPIRDLGCDIGLSWDIYIYVHFFDPSLKLSQRSKNDTFMHKT